MIDGNGNKIEDSIGGMPREEVEAITDDYPDRGSITEEERNEMIHRIQELAASYGVEYNPS